jgi:prophage regulatory protein
MKQIKRTSPQSDAARRRNKPASMDVVHGFPLKRAAVEIGKLTLVKSNPPRSERVVLPLVQAVPAVLRPATDFGVASCEQMLLTESTGSNSEESSAAPAQARVVEAFPAALPKEIPAEPAGTGEVAESAAMELKAPGQMEAGSATYQMADLVAEVKQLRLVIEAAMAAMAQLARPRPANRRPARPLDLLIPSELVGKKLLEMPAVEALVGAKSSTIYGWIKKGKFVPQVQLSPKASRWVASEVEAWLDARTANRDRLIAGTQAN